MQNGLDKILEATLPFANALEKAYLGIGQDAEGGSSLSILASVARVLGSINSDELVRLELSLTSLRKADILKVLYQHKKTLKQVILEEVALAGSWVQLISWIRNNLSLDKLVINGVSELDEQDLTERGDGRPTLWVRGGFDIRGPAKMQPALDKFLAQKRKESAGDEDHGLEEYKWLRGGQVRVIE